jgi:hypothetical protein
MNPQLSRRVGRLMHNKAIMGLSNKEHDAFVADVGAAADFDHLAPRWQKVIMEAEAEEAAGGSE